jgi:hypothetical protein
MDLKNQLTKTPYLVLFIVLITVGVGSASALITITLAGNVYITDDLEVDGKSTFHSSIIQERPSGNSDNIVIQRDGGAANDKPKFVFSQRSNNVQLWLYGNDGSTFKNFIGFDFPNYNVRIPANGDTLTVDGANDKVGMGTVNPTSALQIVSGGSDFTPNEQGIQLTGSDQSGNPGIELTANDGTPYIDFQNDTSGTDYDARIILLDNNTLSIKGADVETSGEYTYENNHERTLIIHPLSFISRDNSEFERIGQHIFNLRHPSIDGEMSRIFAPIYGIPDGAIIKELSCAFSDHDSVYDFEITCFISEMEQDSELGIDPGPITPSVQATTSGNAGFEKITSSPISLVHDSSSYYYLGINFDPTTNNCSNDKCGIYFAEIKYEVSKVD